MIEFLGWLNIVLILFLGSLAPLKHLAAQQRGLRPLYNRVRKIHPWLGGLIVIIGLSHGSMALGGLRLHTGLVLVGAVALNGAIALAGSRVQGLKKHWRPIHRGAGLLVYAALVIHLFWRGLI